MGEKRQRAPSPFFRNPPPYNPVTGERQPAGPPPVDLTRVALMQVTAIEGDYLVCQGFDPEAEKFFKEVSVSKPYLLQTTPWDGRTVTVGSRTVTYSFTGGETRTATWTNPSEVINESIGVGYFVGDVLTCAKPRTRIGDTPGARAGPDSGIDEIDRPIGIMYDDNSIVIQWLDLNVGGRYWYGPAAATGTGGEMIQCNVNMGSGLTTGDGTITVDGVVAMQGGPFGVITEVDNVGSAAAADGTLVFAWYNNATLAWQGFPVKFGGVNPVTSLQVDVSTFQFESKHTQTTFMGYVEDEDVAWVSWHTGEQWSPC